MFAQANVLRFRDIKTKAGLKAAIKAEWAKITPDICKNIAKHYWKPGGTLDKCIAADGGRFTKSTLRHVANDED